MKGSNKSKEIALIGVYVALLIGGQFALSAVSGVEIVTLLTVGFAFFYGVKRTLLLTLAFSLLRCFLFGFFPNVIILYLVYYIIFSFAFGGIGNLFKHKLNPKRHVLVVIVGVVFVLFFTALDNLITPLYYGMDRELCFAYATTSFYAMLPQILCNVITLSLFLRPIIKLFDAIGLKA